MHIDSEALRAKYRAERDKRVRDDGISQYIELDTEVLVDQYADPNFKRDPVEKHVEFLIVGGGWGGQLIAANLQKAGISDLLIVEKAGDFGGVWYWNRYPGAACDTEAYIYMPLLEELGYMPTEKYARSKELLKHAQAVGKHFGLYEKSLFQTEVLALEWNEGTQRWTATTNRNDKITAKFVATSSGPLHNPKLPGIPGIGTFRGHTFHTTRWDYNYTGGDSTGGLDKIGDKRIGIIGTGATSVQAIPHLAEGAGHLYVFQRTPSSIDHRKDGPTDQEWAKKLTPGWQRKRMENFNIIVTGGHQDEDLVNDNWTDILRNLAVYGGPEQETASEAGQERLQLADFNKMNQIRSRIDKFVKDPATAEKLKPWYNQFCKRPCFHNEYLNAYNRPNVTLVDTDGKGVERITEKGIVANGKEYELDCIIYATGFEYAVIYSNRSTMVVRGRDGITLNDKWAKEGACTLHGFHSRGFPNLFTVSLLQSGLTPNLTHMLTEQAEHIAWIVAECQKRKVNTIEASEAAQKQWTETIIELGKLQAGFVQECTPGYYNNEGKPSELLLRNSPYGLGSPAFIKLLDDWRKAGQLEGLECK
ncbi:hypothetical protein AJ78_05172 [Emergomyces pasteurianus Ep9510]|uniref:FAD/NAD(P)-binding domain-containing protein n=1 Tax=Emergomyces pasteurianus Ep9510 TaxID=1447872 RepID=A0A1J9PD37_9EURO|nr:hypothetical protein AJ78_05172 [Emergomyces pasteurianus Ep9510]